MSTTNPAARDSAKRNRDIDLACIVGIGAAVAASWDVGFALHLVLTAIAGMAVGFLLIGTLLTGRSTDR